MRATSKPGSCWFALRSKLLRNNVLTIAFCCCCCYTIIVFALDGYLDLSMATFSTASSSYSDEIIMPPTDAFPSHFSSSLVRTLAQRGLNGIHPASLCNIAAWFYGDTFECGPHASQMLTVDTVHNVQEDDTVYIYHRVIPGFVRDILPQLNVTVVMFIGQYHFSYIYEGFPGWTSMLDSPFVRKVYSMSIDHYLSTAPSALSRVQEPPPEGNQSWSALVSQLRAHPKLAPWPYGLDSWMQFGEYKKAFWKHLCRGTNKTKGVMRGYINVVNNPVARTGVPSGDRKPFGEYVEELAEHRFILSPDGDRPECHRHYEAIGLGTIPITGMSQDYYGHLKDAPVLYNTTNWNLDATEAMARLGVTPDSDGNIPEANPIYILEEYWMEYAERGLGGAYRLRWFDRLQDRKAKLKDFVLMNSTPATKDGVCKQYDNS
jgi:hypothetical protein